MPSDEPTETNHLADGESPPIGAPAWRPYHYSKKSMIAFGGVWALYLIVVESLPLANWGMPPRIWFWLYAVPVVLFPAIFLFPQIRRQKRERKKTGQPASRFSRTSQVAFYSSFVLYFIAAESFKAPVKLGILLNNLFGKANPTQLMDMALPIWLIWVFLVVVAPMLILACIFFGPQYYRQKRERRKKEAPRVIG